MSKVGILSMQRIFNYGSFLQAYGLKKILEDLGCNVEFVDYHPGECLVIAESGRGLSRKISKVLEVFRNDAPLKEKIRFIMYKKNYAANYYPYLGINKTMNYAPELDLLVVGSDEVFNCVQNNPNVGFSPELFGISNHAKKLISYAASFGNTTLQHLEQYKVRDRVTEYLSKFNAISVRDANSGAVVKGLTGQEPHYNLDPVLAYDFIGKCNVIPSKVPESKYMILYGYSGRFSIEECKAIRAYAKQKGWKIFCIGGVQDCCDKFIDCSPFQVIVYFQHAEAIITDTFHGTIISVITHQKFVSLVRRGGYGNAEKLTDLLERLHLSDRIICDMESLSQMLASPIKYEETDSIIRTGRKHTYEYLRQEISHCIQG
ncbi:polysaccharide pyruvyl transferase family protein [Desulfosporosinus hippei]|uniref:Polysaccharide pyruvyl transferase n=1 Tax=Desulfosporosinus hippei DSM 8344 TaxID=1121419 RepID=A0A1G8EVH8_9FIRM|nr:polysaccharide pyruvyl transferase family protein [Desulfosporosinus hippei]SDH73845.1 Polysaccharide pyruvyl transferase [Desulfosporosinus hippei DSM 8344]